MEIKTERVAPLEENIAALKRLAEYLLRYGVEKGTIKMGKKEKSA